ncbi:MAG: VanZ family protein [Clostridia bacterium]|nr:VanZ family protein [Clostridia bacterium]
MKDGRTNKGKIIALRVALTAACVALVAFIFFNSLRTGDESAAQSNVVTDFVQKVIAFFAPKSWIANATGEAYERLHGYVRTVAHFSEFGLLGALMVWCWRAYTADGLCLLFPMCLTLFIPVLDESLQFLTAGRVADISDLFVDTLGGFCGLAFAVIALLIGRAVLSKKRKGD